MQVMKTLEAQRRGVEVKDLDSFTVLGAAGAHIERCAWQSMCRCELTSTCAEAQQQLVSWSVPVHHEPSP